MKSIGLLLFALVVGVLCNVTLQMLITFIMGGTMARGGLFIAAYWLIKGFLPCAAHMVTTLLILRSRYRFQITAGLLAGLLLLGFAGYVAYSAFALPGPSWGLYFMSGGIIFGALLGSVYCYLNERRNSYTGMA